MRLSVWLALFFNFATCAFAQNTIMEWEQLGLLHINREHAAWSSPEAIVKDLASEDETVRSKALALIGVPEKEADNELGGLTLQYAYLGSEPVRQAIISVDLSSYAFTAIGLHRGGSWQRIAAFACWCKYDSPMDFAHLDGAPNGPRFRPGSEVVLRASSGGTGYYEQTEAHYRLHRSEMVAVASFRSKLRDCQFGDSFCTIERRWLRNGELVFGAGKMPFDFSSPASGSEESFITRRVCTPYKWDATAFRYQLSGPSARCK